MAKALLPRRTWASGLPEWVIHGKIGIVGTHVASLDGHLTEVTKKAALDCLSQTHEAGCRG